VAVCSEAPADAVRVFTRETADEEAAGDGPDAEEQRTTTAEDEQDTADDRGAEEAEEASAAGDAGASADRNADRTAHQGEGKADAIAETGRA
jgi:hypothetical protein